MDCTNRIEIRPYSREYRKDIIDICHDTGFMGEALRPTGRFRDKKLFALIFALYYTDAEPQNCLIALDTLSGKTAGYIIGTHDTVRQRALFKKKFYWKIIVRVFCITIWRYPGSALVLAGWLRRMGADENGDFLRQYPAHLHINVAPYRQNSGTGTLLLAAFENLMKERGAAGVHLITSSRNIKALPFYATNGYAVYKSEKEIIWSGVRNLRRKIFVKNL